MCVSYIYIDIYISFYIYLIAWCLSATNRFMLSYYDNHQADEDDGMKSLVADKLPFY